MPGTLWCSSGNKVATYENLGVFAQTVFAARSMTSVRTPSCHSRPTTEPSTKSSSPCPTVTVTTDSLRVWFNRRNCLGFSLHTGTSFSAALVKPSPTQLEQQRRLMETWRSVAIFRSLDKMAGGPTRRAKRKDCSVRLHKPCLRMTKPKAEFLEAVRRSNQACQQGQYSLAVQLYGEALSADPQNCILYSNRSAALLHLGQYQTALDDALKARLLNPKWPKLVAHMEMALRVAMLGSRPDWGFCQTDEPL
ncbi:hypothetical protein J4Q44_G00132450 [Coregonus suidteri]|uniref:Tetratricopeptide repeat protein 28 n=1 Tax=Coregonus suidteri TaxID=861788 RepID=A0AAN8MAU7_9TELE